MIRRIIGAALLNTKVYEDVEHDKTADRQAYLVVLVAAALVGLGAGLSNGPEVSRSLALLVYAIVVTFVLYFVWAGVAYYLGTGYFGGKADPGQLRRTIGFAHGPQALGFFVFLNPWIWWIGALWSLAAAFVATRQALDVSNGKTLVVLLLSGGIVVMVGFFVMGFLGLWILPAGLTSAG
jgi:hypothetical protein